MTSEQIASDIAKEYTRDQYGMYLRKSRADLEMEALGEGETLARHKNMLEALAAKHNISMNQITVYKEMVSGDSIDERPEMQKLLADVYAKKYVGVLVVEVERLARGNTKDQGEVADAFQSSSTLIITPAKTYDPNNEFDQEYFEFGLFMSRREYKTIRRRLEAGKKQSVMEGNYLLPQRIFGFDIVRTSKKDRFLVPNEKETKIVQMIFDWFTIERKSTGKIATELSLMGIPTLKGGKEWSRGTIRDMLSNVHYIGMVSWNKQSTVKQYNEETGKLEKKKLYNGKREIFKGKHEGIISKEQFDAAQTLFSSNAPVKKDVELINPFAGLLVCSGCGKCINIIDYSRFKGSGNRKSRFTHQRGVYCKKKSMPVDEVIEAILVSLNAFITDFEFRIENNNDQTELIRHSQMIEAMESELAKNEKKRSKLFFDYEDDVYTKDEFIERKQIYNQTIETLKKQIQEAKKFAPAPVDYSVKIENIHKIIDCIQNPDLSAKAKNDFLKQFVEKIVYDVIDYGTNKGGKVVLDVLLK